MDYRTGSNSLHHCLLPVLFYYMEQFFLISLAVWRLSSLIARERGPYNMFQKLRLKFGVIFDAQGEEIGTSNLSDGILCVWCSSIYFASLAALLTTSDPVMWIINTLAISTIAIIVDSLVMRE